MAWIPDQGKLCNALGKCSPSMAEIAAPPVQQRAKYFKAGTSRRSLRRRDPEETKTQTQIEITLSSECQGLRADALPHLCEMKKYF